MSAMKKGLGRGFESLIPIDLLDDDFDPTAQQDEQVSELRHLALNKIHANPDQPRRSFDKEALEELAASIKEYGVPSRSLLFQIMVATVLLLVSVATARQPSLNYRPFRL